MTTDQPRSKLNTLRVPAMLLLVCMLNGCDSSCTQAPDLAETQRPMQYEEEVTPRARAEEPTRQPPTFDVDRLDFGTLPPGQFVNRTVTLTNPNAAPLQIDLRKPGTSAFNFTGACVDQATLPPRGRCALIVTFQPTTEQTFSEVLAFGADGKPRLPLTAIAKAPVVERPPMAVMPTDAEIIRRRVLAQTQAASVQIARPTRQATYKDPSQDNWNALGWDQNFASMPVDTSRVILRGTPIPVRIVNSLNTQLGCPVNAIVQGNIYADMAGPEPLIEQGSIVTGQCQPIGGIDQTRVAIIWDRLLTGFERAPDGRVLGRRAINIASPALDQMGRAGIPGQVDTQFFQRYGRSLLISILGAGSTYLSAQDNNQPVSVTTGPLGVTSSTSVSPQQQAFQQLQQQLNQIGQQMLQEGTNFLPRIEIPAGSVAVIYPMTDIWFRDYEIVAVDERQFERERNNAAAPLRPRGPQDWQLRATGGQQPSIGDVQRSGSGTVYETRKPPTMQPTTGVTPQATMPYNPAQR